MSKIFGGSKQRSTSQSNSVSSSSSSNRAFEGLNTSFSPLTSNAQTGSNALAAILGGDSTGFNSYLDATGFDFNRERGEGALTTMLGSRGLRNSGGAMKALSQFNTGLNQQYAGNYMDRLLQQAGLGFNAGNLISGAGGTANSSSTSNSTGTQIGSSSPGIGGLFGGVGSIVAASDRTLKTDIKKVGKTKEGLNLYTYKYIGRPETHTGVMADEVRKIKPEALGPKVMGFDTVDYSKLEVA